jgi:hypothetical protein
MAMKKIFSAFFLALGCVTSAQAAVVVDHLIAPADVDVAYCSHCGSGGLDTTLQGFAHFTLAASATLTNLDWEIDSSDAYGIDTVRVSLWNGDRSLLLFSHDYMPGDIGETTLGPMFNGDTVAMESVSLPGVAVGPGAYQLSIVGFGASSHQYSWVSKYGGADSWFGVGGTEDTVDTTFALRLSDQRSAVPEPSSWAMMICGFGAAGSALRRRGAVSARNGLLKRER